MCEASSDGGVGDTSIISQKIKVHVPESVSDSEQNIPTHFPDQPE